jgi:hypothetical protein
MFAVPGLYINKNGIEQLLSEVADLHGLHVLNVTPAAPQLTPTYYQNPGLDGQMPIGDAVYGLRTLSVDFYFEGQDVYDFEMACKAIHGFFFERFPYYIRSTLMPGFRYMVLPKPYDPTRLNIADFTFTIDFDMPTGLREAFQTTLEAPMTYDAEAWQLQMNLPVDQDLAYVFNASQFSVYNASDIVINPLKHHLLDIALTCVGTPTITNLDTSDSFTLNQAMSSSDALLLSGFDPYLNNTRCGRLTNHGVITLQKGWNRFSITGCSNPVTAFNTRFLYL